MANQEACASARIIYVLCRTDVDAIENLNFFGKLIYEAMLSMPSELTSKPVTFDRELRDQMEATRLDDTFYRIIGGEDNEGAIIVSQFDEPVDYSALLSGRVANLVPIDDIKKVTDAVNAYTTVGI